MFDNIGGKIRNLAVVSCVIGMIGSVAIGLILFTNSTPRQPLVLPGILVIVIGCLSAWIGSFAMYGFGALVESNESVAYQMMELANKLEKMNRQNVTTTEEKRSESAASYWSTPSVSKMKTWRCRDCGSENAFLNNVCTKCGADR